MIFVAKIKTTDYQNFVAYFVPSQKVNGGVYLTVMLDNTDKTYVGPNGKESKVSQAAISRGEVRFDKQPEIETNLDSKGKHTTYYSDSQYRKMEAAARNTTNSGKQRYEQEVGTGRLCLQFRAKLVFNKKGSPVIDTRQPILESTNQRFSAAYACNNAVKFAQAQDKYDKQYRQDKMTQRLGDVVAPPAVDSSDYATEEEIPFE